MTNLFFFASSAVRYCIRQAEDPDPDIRLQGRALFADIVGIFDQLGAKYVEQLWDIQDELGHTMRGVYNSEYETDKNLPSSLARQAD